MFKFCYIDIKPYIIKKDLRTIYSNIRSAFYDHNLLLAKELALYELNENTKRKLNMFHNILAMINEELKFPLQAEYHYGQAIEIKPHQAIYYWNFASLLKLQGRYDEAIQLLKKGMEYDKDEEKMCYLFVIAECLENSNQNNNALLYYKQMAQETIAIFGNHNNGKNYLLQAVGLMKCEKMNIENK